MTITAAPVIQDGSLMVRGKTVLTKVPENVVVTSATGSGSAFVGARSDEPKARNVFDLGILENCKFMCLFIAKVWWMIPRVGTSGGEIPMETQFLLLEIGEESALRLAGDDEEDEEGDGNKIYVLVLPVLDGAFRTSLQGNKANNELQFCYESGDSEVETSEALRGVFVNSGDNPYELIRDSIKILAKLKGTFSHLEKKKIPAHLDWFGWCTWDAFYTDVSPKGIKDGLQSFKEGGISPKFLIIDDGWQEVENEFQKEGEPLIEGTQFATRLAGIKENEKFKSSSDGSSLKELIHDIKSTYDLKYVYMWHALAGYWGGVHPSNETLKKYNPELAYPTLSPGNIGNIRDVAMDCLEKYGVGVVDPERIYDFYDDMHSYLANSGVDGVKVDVQNLIETLGSGNGGRVALTKKYYEALDDSVEKYFGDNNLICCMCHNSDLIFSSKRSATARASEDFMPNEPTFQTLHIATVSFNSLLLGEVVVPDWDMFHSDHSTAEFHGAARAIGGCPVYVSDKPGKHDFNILKKLVLPDGSILRARHAGRPTKDCLFTDPVMDGKSLLKIWNLNKLNGVVGVFNCQGAGSWPMKEPNPKGSGKPISGRVCPNDVEFSQEMTDESWDGECAVYAFNSGTLSKAHKNKGIQVSLSTLQCEIFTVAPINVFKDDVRFAPIGLIEMYNSGGAVEDCRFDESVVTIKARGSGIFGAYSSTRPSSCKVDKRVEEFIYDYENGMLTVDLRRDGNSFKEIEVLY